MTAANPVVLSNPAAFAASGGDHDWTHQFGDDSIVDPQLRFGAPASADTPSSLLDFSFDNDSMGYFGQMMGDRDAAAAASGLDVGDANDANGIAGSATASSPRTSRTADTSSSITSASSSHVAPVTKGKKHTMADHEVEAEDGAPTAKRRTSTRKAKQPQLPQEASQQTQQQQKQQKQHKPSRQQKKQQQQQQDAITAPTPQPQTSGRRNNCLERNRVAASKCRQKKKEWVHDLEETKDKLEVQHLALMSEFCHLQEEVTMIKELLMAHANCNDPKIGNWIGEEAVRFVQKAVEPSGCRKQSTVDSFSPLRSRNGSVVQASPGSVDQSMFPSAHPGNNRNNNINYDFMPDELFNDDAL